MSYLVLGLLAREGTSTPYDLKRHVAGTIGHFWSIPPSLLYREPERLAGFGLVTEEQEPAGRHRRLFTITPAGRDALRRWFSSPALEAAELRDPGLLQFALADLATADQRVAIAEAQLAIHGARLARYEDEQRSEARSRWQTVGTDGRPLAQRYAAHESALRARCDRVLGERCGGGSTR